MAGGAGVQNGNADAAVFYHIQNTADQISGIQGNSFPRLQIDLQIPRGLGVGNRLLQAYHIIVIPGNVVPATHIQPFHPGQHITKFGFHCFQSFSQVVGILLTKGVKVQPVQKRQQILCHFPVPDFPGDTQTAAGGTGVVNGMAFLGGAFGIDTQSQTFSFGQRAELFQLVNGVENNVVGVVQQFRKFFFPIGTAKHMDFPISHFFSAQSSLI